MAEESAFEIPARPARQFHSRGELEYDGGTVFVLDPADSLANPTLRDLVTTVLETGPYRSGDFYELPMPLWLVRDDETGDVFRVAIRDGTVQLHVGPETDAAGLRAFYDRLRASSDTEWSVTSRVKS